MAKRKVKKSVKALRSAAAKKSSGSTTRKAQPADAIGVGVWPAAFASNPFNNAPANKNMETMMSKSQTQFDTMTKDAAEQMRESMEAYAKSCKVSAERVQEMMSTCMALCQDASEKQASAFKTLMGCKTVNDVTEAQSKFAQQGFDEIMTAMTKMTEMSIKMANECLEPINDQITKAVRKASDTMAA